MYYDILYNLTVDMGYFQVVYVAYDCKLFAFDFLFAMHWSYSFSL